jgi:putative ABC transport system ATP-binding protein
MVSLVEVHDLQKIYRTGAVTCEALRDVSIDIAAGEFVTVMGHSGSGKSTLLHLIGGLDRPTAGSIEVDGRALHTMNETTLAKFRRRHIGFVFQFFNLIDNLTVRTNVELPALLTKGLGNGHKPAIRDRSNELLERLGIGQQGDKHPWELSGGQQQRVAIARALINRPSLLLVDEPTGNLDSTSSETVLDILSECHERSQTILMVTHDPRAAARGERVLFLHDGDIVDQMTGGGTGGIAQRLAELK